MSVTVGWDPEYVDDWICQLLLVRIKDMSGTIGWNLEYVCRPL